LISIQELKQFHSLISIEKYTVGPIVKEVTYDNFDAAGNLTDMTGPEGQSWHYTYDDANRLTKTEKSSATLVELDYLDNDITENVRYAGIPNLGMFYTHDDYNRLEQIDFRNTAGSIDQRAYEFTVDRQIKKITEDAGVQDFTYDDLKRLDTANDTRDEASLLYDFGYDDTGGRTSYRVSGKYGTTETIVTGRIQGSTAYEKLFEDDFEDGILGPEWHVINGTWWEADGSLHGILEDPGSNPGGIIIRGQSYWHEYAVNVDMYWPAVWEPEHPAVGILFNMDDDINYLKLNFRQDTNEIDLYEIIDGSSPYDPIAVVDASAIPDGDLLNVYIESIGLDVFVVVTSSVGQYILSGTATTHMDGNIAFRTTETEIEITQARVDALVRTAHDYDAEGSLSTRIATAFGGTVDMGSETFTFDAEDRIKHIERIPRNGPTRNIYYAYDALGRRFAKTINGQTELYVYAGPNIIQSYDYAGVTPKQTFTTMGVDNHISVEDNATSEEYYYMKDHLGSIQYVVDDTGAVQNEYKYNAYGESMEGTTENVEQPYRFTGREWDNKVGIYYYRARYYDPKVGRFLTKDPVYQEGMELYGYVGGNPVNNTDPFGLSVQIIENFDAVKNKNAAQSRKHKIHIKFKATLVDKSKKKLSKEQMQTAADFIRQSLNEVYKGEYAATKNYGGMAFDMDAEINIGMNGKKKDPTDHIIEIIPKGGFPWTSEGNKPVGQADFFKDLIKLDLNLFIGDENQDNKLKKAVAHELGHSLGLYHPGDNRNKIKKRLGRDNLMQRTTQRLGTELIAEQIGRIVLDVKKTDPKKSPFESSHHIWPRFFWGRK